MIPEPAIWLLMQKTSDINVVETRALPSPAALLSDLPPGRRAELWRVPPTLSMEFASIKAA